MKKNILVITILTGLLIGTGILLFRNRVKTPQPMVAFVIDDWGYNMRNLDSLFQIDRPITISILPNLYYSKDIAEEVRRHNSIDMILHLPLESKNNINRERRTLMTDMQDEEILSILEDDIESLPGIVGVSNHQGSKATEDKRIMRIIFRELKKRGLFFLDSLTTPNSICKDVANDVGLSFSKRDVFLDQTDKKDKEEINSYIKKQIQKLADMAVRNATAIGVGHDKAITLNLIRDSIPELEKQGIKIVALKQLIK